MLLDAGREAVKYLAGDRKPALIGKAVQLHLHLVMFETKVVSRERNRLHCVPPDINNFPPDLKANQLPASWAGNTEVAAQGFREDRGR